MKGTARDRLAPLVALINKAAEQTISSAEQKRVYTAFIETFDGTDRVKAGKVAMNIGKWPTLPLTITGQDNRALTSTQAEGQWLDVLRFCLQGLLIGDLRVPLTTISIRTDPDNGIVVYGAMPDVVLYLVARLKADYFIDIESCIAPLAAEPGQRNDWKQRCNNLIIVGGTRGVRPKYCCDNCRQRAKNPNWKQRQHKEKQT